MSLLNMHFSERGEHQRTVLISIAIFLPLQHTVSLVGIELVTVYQQQALGLTIKVERTCCSVPWFCVQKRYVRSTAQRVEHTVRISGASIPLQDGAAATHWSDKVGIKCGFMHRPDTTIDPRPSSYCATVSNYSCIHAGFKSELIRNSLPFEWP
jgi:hypothetical protein